MSSRSLNKAMLIGNLTRDPELRYTPAGTAVCSFGLATNRSWMPSDSNERREETEFHRIVAWNKLAELCSQLLTKGRKVYVEGRLQTRSWETPNGEKRQTTEIVAEDMVILDQRKDGTREEKEESKDEVVEEKQEKDEAVKAGEDKEKSDKKEVRGQKGKSDKKKDEEKAEKEEANPPAGGEEEIDIDDIPF